MGQSQAVVTVNNFDIGPCRVTFDGVDLGGTLSNVVVNFKYEKAPLKADQHGTSLLDEAISGIEVTVETEVAEVKDKDTLKKVFPNSTLVSVAGPPAQKALDFEDQIATRMLANSKVLILHPLQYADANLDYDWYFYKAMPSEESSYTLGPSEQGKMKIVWKVYLDLTQTPPKMFRIGDNTI